MPIRYSKKIKMEQKICPICFDGNGVSFKTMCCKQFFHEKCFQEWVYELRHYNCPLCRSFIYKNNPPKLAKNHNLWTNQIEFVAHIFDILYVICGLFLWFLFGYTIYFCIGKYIDYFDLNYDYIIL